MLIVMRQSATLDDVRRVEEEIKTLGLRPVSIPGAERTAIGVIGNQGYVDDTALKGIPAIREIIHVTKPYKLVSRDFHPANTRISLGNNSSIGAGSDFIVMAGPCAVESPEQMFSTARLLKELGVQVLRGGAYKPRTSPHSFQGMREEGLGIFKSIKKELDIAVITEVVSPEHIEPVSEAVDILQIGARNMQNYDLLKEVGKTDKPVVLKRGLSATMEEWLAAAEYIVLEGNPNVIMCERGIRTFETATRNTADLAIVPLLKEKTHLPVIFDPSHATGIRSLVGPMSLAAVVAGADGLMVEVHPDPAKALSDGAQSLDFDAFRLLWAKINKLGTFING